MGPVILATRGTSVVPEFAGSTWVRLQYVLGLQSLGIRVIWVDRLKEPLDPSKYRRSIGYFTHRFAQMAEEFGFADSFFIADHTGKRLAGVHDDELAAMCADAELLIAISEIPPPSSPLRSVARRAYVDVDPGFTQIWAHQVNLDFDAFTVLFTTGLNVGASDFTIPIQGRRWNPTAPPIALDWWPSMIDSTCDAFTTVADWQAPQIATFDGVEYGGKRREFLRLIELPQHTYQRLTLALAIEGEYSDAVPLAEKGWDVVDSYRFAGDVFAYREFIQTSRAEFSVAKHGYVKSRSGWISDRTAAYLASGKPALVQSTALEEHLPTGRGLVTFRDMDEALRGIEMINDDYVGHCEAARRLAEQHFSARVVLPRMLEIAGV